jgi:GxxExxY protein
MSLLQEKETYQIIGLCMEVHKNLGPGFLEIVYKDALEYELIQNNIEFEREKEYKVNYKGVLLNHQFYADFVVFGNIILEVKNTKSIHESHIAQAINYLKVSGNKVALIVNFGERSLIYKRLTL